jgi:hypothetical protein
MCVGKRDSKTPSRMAITVSKRCRRYVGREARMLHKTRGWWDKNTEANCAAMLLCYIHA